MTWYSPLISTALSRRHVFWHSSALHRSSNLAADLQASASETCTMQIIDCSALPLLSDRSDVDAELIANVPGDLLVLLDFHRLLEIRRGRAWMRQLRPAVLIEFRVARRFLLPVIFHAGATPPSTGAA